MLLRILPLLLLLGCNNIISASSDAKNETKEVKTKRGIYHLSDPTYNVLPLHHLTRYTQVRALSDDPSQVDLTYKSHEDAKAQLEQGGYPQNAYEYGDALKVSSNNHFKINEPSHLNHHHYPSYAAQYSNPIAQQTAKSHDHLALPPQHLVAPQYSQYQKLSSPIPFYGADKHLALPANIRTTSEIKLPEYIESYTTIPIIYGQPGGGLPSLKYIQPLPKPQYNLQSYNTLPLQNSYQPSPYKLPVKLQVAPLQQHRQFQPSLVQNFKPLNSNYFQPQVFENPIVPQLQHYIPSVQSPFDAFTKPAPVAPVAPPKPTPAPQQKEQEEESDDDDEDERHERKEVRGEIVRHEVNDEEEFDKGYDDAAKGFPHHDDEDDYRQSRYHNDDEDRYERYRSKYDADQDDDHRGYHSTHRERSRKPYDHDDDRRSRHSDRDHEGHYSQKTSKKEPREKHHKSKASYESSKYYRNEDSDRSPKKSSKYYKSSTKKPYSDSRHVSSSPKKLAVKKPAFNSKESASSRSEVEFKPSYEYGFEPIKVVDTSRSREVDSVAKHSEPNQNRKLYKENWFYSKTSKSQ